MNKKCPDKIYLQACDKCYAEASGFEDGVTWCVDEIGHMCNHGLDEETKDVEYVRLSWLIRQSCK